MTGMPALSSASGTRGLDVSAMKAACLSGAASSSGLSSEAMHFAKAFASIGQTFVGAACPPLMLMAMRPGSDLSLDGLAANQDPDREGEKARTHSRRRSR
jgi:hypothetical protein